MGFYGAQFMKKWLFPSLFVSEKSKIFWNFFEIFEKSKNQKFTNSLDWNLKILSGLKLVFRALSFRSTDIKKVIFGQFDSKLIPWSFSETFYPHSTPILPRIQNREPIRFHWFCSILAIFLKSKKNRDLK